jgi:hypothetical protein
MKIDFVPGTTTQQQINSSNFQPKMMNFSNQNQINQTINNFPINTPNVINPMPFNNMSNLNHNSLDYKLPNRNVQQPYFSNTINTVNTNTINTLNTMNPMNTQMNYSNTNNISHSNIQQSENYFNSLYQAHHIEAPFTFVPPRKISENEVKKKKKNEDPDALNLNIENVRIF